MAQTTSIETGDAYSGSNQAFNAKLFNLYDPAVQDITQNVLFGLYHHFMMTLGEENRADMKQKKAAAVSTDVLIATE